MKKKLLLFAALFTATVMNLQAAEAVSYLYPEYNTSGNPTSGIKAWKTGSCTSYTVVTDASSTVTWNAGWYVVKGNVTLSKGAVCNGAVNLILANGAMLTTTGGNGNYSAPSFAGIQVSGSSNSLTIYGQAGQSGILIAKGGVNADDENYAAAGIGGGASTGEDDCSGSNITINGGMVTATGGGGGAAGIGGGSSMEGNAFGKNITINGGTVTATGGEYAAGIGGGHSEDSDGTGSYITINGGTVTATGGDMAAGIGGGREKDGSHITINGGKIDAKANDQSQSGAGIGGGHEGIGSDITITGGEVTATGGSYAAGIGGGGQGYDGSNITITGGKVTAKGGLNAAAGIGGGRNGSGSNITISGGEIEAYGGENGGAGIGSGALGNCSNITIDGGMVTATGGENAAGIGGGWSGSASNIFVNPSLILKADGNNPPTTVIAHATITTDVASLLAGKRYATVTEPEPLDPVKYLAPVYNTTGDPQSGILRWDTLSCTEYKVVADVEEEPEDGVIYWGEDEQDTWYVVNGEVNLSWPVYIYGGNVHLILADGAKLTVNGADGRAGITIEDSDYSFTIYGQSAQTGQLLATGGEYGAGIGGGNYASGSNITINGGEVTATGGQSAAGIGGGDGGSGSYITINGGMITATGGSVAAGIGGGSEGSGSNITINGGKVIATGGENGAGIGGGKKGAGSDITINGGTVNTTGGYDAAGIGGGDGGSGSNITIKGGEVTATGDDGGAGIGGGSSSTGSNITINGGTVTATGGENAAGIGGGWSGSASNIFVNPSLLLKADGNNPPTTVIAHATITTDVASQLAGKRYAMVETPAGPDMHDFLYFVGLNGNDTVRLNKVASNDNDLKQLTATFEYSKDRINWSAYTWDATDSKTGAAIELKTAGDTVFFRAKGTNGKNATMSIKSSIRYLFTFGADDQIAAGGNTMSLYDATCEQDTMTQFGFYKLFFGAKQLVTAPKLPAKKMAKNCCYMMFNGCTSLTTAPELKATTLAQQCYSNMFNGCSSLQVDTCTGSCDGVMFEPTTIGDEPTGWNGNMFDGCNGTITRPQLGGHYCIKEYKEGPDMHDFLYFVGLNGNDTVRLNKYAINAKNLPNLTATFEYSKDRINWTAYDTWATSADPTNTYQGAAIALNQGDTVFFRAGGVNGKNATMSSGSSAYFNFAFGADDSIAAGGNTMSLYDATCEQDTMTAYGFYRLFKDAKQLVSAPKLPAKKMADYSYNTMFQSCTSLVTAPKLPATTLNNSCYMGMFSFCSSLTQAPELPATTLAEACYSNMFQSCTSLTQAPELKATTLAGRCYASMFDGCTSLIVAPELKATTLHLDCYYKMFSGCTSLEVDTCADGSCDGVKFNPTTVGTEPASWSAKMFDGCKGTIIRPQLGGHYCIKEYKEPDMHDMLYFTSLKDNGTVRLNKYGGTDLAKLTATFEYSKDRKTWTEYTWGGTDNKKGAAITLANAGDTVFFRAKGTNGKNATMSYNEVTYFLFAFNTGDSIAAGGNVMSLYDASCEQDTMTAYGFSNLFKDCAKKLVSVSELKLSVTKLAKGCYYGMFYNCLKITDVPALPVTTLAPSCYVFMFYRCTSLTVAPVLPATTLADNCYSNMFSGCTALTQAPELNATVLASKCYNLMFAGCSSLTVAPELKATALVDSCYKQMFKGCTNLEVDTCTGSCDGVKFNPTTSGDAPINWNLNMFDGCKGDAKYTAEHGIQLGGHYCIKEYKEPDMHDMLYFTSLKDNGTVKLNKHGKYVSGLTATFEYSKDRKTWTEYTWATEDNPKYVYQGAAIALAKGDTVFFRAKGVKGKNATMTNGDGHFRFAFGANDSIAAGGNVMSLYDATCEQDTMTAYGFMNLFMDAKQLVSAPKLTASKLAHGCYSNMFFDCSALAQAPELPNTTLAKYCYSMMFHGCSALTAAPALPATVLEEDCYNGMFGGCTALTKAPELKATTLAEGCYRNMFQGDTALIQAPELKATTLAENCYNGMFNGCTKLEVDTFSVSCDGAELVVPDTTAAPTDWNKDMFTGCKGAYANNIKLGGHYCIKKFVPVITGITLTGFDDTYDGKGHAVQVSGTKEGDVIEFSADSTTWKSTNPSFKSVVDTLIYVRVQRTDYNDWGGSAKITIDPKKIEADADAEDKDYDGTTTAEVYGFLDGVIAGDDVKLTATGTFADKNVGEGKTVTITFSISGKDAGNYILDEYSDTDDADIDPKKLSVAGQYVEDKTYDGYTTATINIDELEGVVSGDDVTVSATGTFADKNVGEGKTVSVVYTLSGNDAGNYDMDETEELEGNIYPKEISVINTEVKNKTYDGTTDATFITGSLDGVVSGDDVTVSATGEFEDANAGYTKEVNITYTLSGNDANNYYLDYMYEVFYVNITARAITMTSASATKEFDNTPLTKDSIIFSGDGFVGQDTVSCTVTGTQTEVGSSPNSFTYSFSGSAESNYAFTKVEGTLEVTGIPTYGRKVTKDKFGTLCLDKKFNAMEGVEGLYVPSYKDATTLYCVEMPLDSVKAGYAYIFKANADSISFTLEGEAVAAAVEANNMKGWLDDDYTLLPADTASTGAFHDYYFFGTPAGASVQQIVKPEAGSTIKQNRAMINLSTVSENKPSSPARYIALRITEATGLVNVNGNADADNNCKMMVNGQLIIIKDGVKYNAQGQKME